MRSGISGKNILNVSSRHACSMLPKTNYENGNYLLDWSALIGTFEEPEKHYFTKILKVGNCEGDSMNLTYKRDNVSCSVIPSTVTGVKSKGNNSFM